jgi:hydroxymethylpyrimidine pyrophosphatase-like HAD family hydrolase
LDIDQFSSIKCFGSYESMKRVAQQMELELQLHAPVIRDPFSDSYFVAQGIHKEASKGFALKTMKALLGYEGITIAAGDDINDQSMFNEADISIAMSGAPPELIKLANIIAPPAAAKGILTALSKALLK